MKLFRFDYSGVYLGGVAIVIAPDEVEAREALLKTVPGDWREESWRKAISEAAIVQFMIPKFTAIIYNSDGDY